MNPTLTVEASPDAVLVEAARRQEPGAYGELFRRWYDRSYDVAMNIIRDREAAADVAQDAFLVGWERLMDLRDPDAFGGWILRTTRNRALNRVTRDRYRTMEPIEGHEEGPSMPDPDADPALHAERSDQRRLIWTAVAALGERDTSLLDLHLRHGLEPAEIAEELRITPNNASQLLFRLRRKLREAIGAVLLWRDGHPTCANLATLLAEGGSFNTQVASTIRRHQRDCNECLREISRQTNPEQLFAAVPLAVAPLLFKERAAAALTQAGIPMAPPAATAVPVPTGPPHGTGRVAAVAGSAIVAITATVAVLWWPSGPDGGTSAAGGSGRRVPSAVVTAEPTTAGAEVPGVPTTPPTMVPTTVPVVSTTAPDAQISHAPRRPAPAPAPARTTTPPTTSPLPSSSGHPIPAPPSRPGPPSPPGPPSWPGIPGPPSGPGDPCPHHGPWQWPWPWPSPSTWWWGDPPSCPWWNWDGKHCIP